MKLLLVSLLQVSLTLSVQADFLGDRFGNVNTPSPNTPTTKPNTIFPNLPALETTSQADNFTLQQQPSTSSPFLPTEDSHNSGGIGHFGPGARDDDDDDDDLSRNKRDVRGQLFPNPSTSPPPSTFRPASQRVTEPPSTSTTGSSLNFGGGSFNRHRRDLTPKPTQKPLLPSTTTLFPTTQSSRTTPTAKPNVPSTAVPTTLPGFVNRNRRDLPGFTFRPQPTFSPQPTLSPQTTSSSTQSSERDSRLFFSFTTKDPLDNSTTTRRSLFNRNRRQTSFRVTQGPVTTSTRRFFQVDEQEATTPISKFPIFGQDKVSSTLDPFSGERATEEPTTSTTRRFGFNRFRRNSHEFPPEDEEEHSAPGHVHDGPTTSTRAPPSTSTSTRRPDFNRFRRNSHEFPPEDEEEPSGPGHVHSGPTTSTGAPPSTSTSTRSPGFNRFRRNSHEFPPEDEEEPSGPAHVHGGPSSSTRAPPPSTSTKKNFHSRVQRSSDDVDDEVDPFKRTTSTERGLPSTSTSRIHPIFHFGSSQGDHSDTELEVTSESSSTERHPFGSGGGHRFRRSDSFDSGSFTFPRRTSTVQPSTSSLPSTKEPSTTTRQPGGHFRN